MNSYKTVFKEGEAELYEKRSKFIGYCCPVSNEDEAVGFINKIRSLHSTATHNVYAYRLIQNSTDRYSDDGEPSKTAGLPVLDILKKESLYNVCIVVTRYFGGTLLGTGGLVRAYSQAAKLAVEKSGICEMVLCYKIKINCDYSTYSKINSYLYQNAYDVVPDFKVDVEITAYIKQTQKDAFFKEIADITSSNANIFIIDTEYFKIKA